MAEKTTIGMTSCCAGKTGVAVISKREEVELAVSPVVEVAYVEVVGLPISIGVVVPEAGVGTNFEIEVIV